MSSEFAELKNINANISVSVMAQRVLQHLSKYRQFYQSAIVDNEIRELQFQLHTTKANSKVNAYNDHKIDDINNRIQIYSRIQEILKICHASFPFAAFSKAKEANDTLVKQNENSKKQTKEFRYNNKLLLVLKNVLEAKKVDDRHLDFSFKSSMVFMGLLIEHPLLLKNLYAHIEELEVLIKNLRFKLEHSTVFAGLVNLLQNNQEFFRMSLDGERFNQFVKTCDKLTQKTLIVLSKELKVRVSSNATFFEEFEDLSFKEMLASQKPGLVGQRLLQENTSIEYFKQLINLEDSEKFKIKIQGFLVANPHVAEYLVVKYLDLNEIVKKWREWVYLDDCVNLMISHNSFFSYMYNFDYYNYFISQHPLVNPDVLIKFIDDFSSMMGEEGLSNFVEILQGGSTIKSILVDFLRTNEDVFVLFIQNQQVLQHSAKLWEALFDKAFKKDTSQQASVNNNHIREEEIEDLSPQATRQPYASGGQNKIAAPASDKKSLKDIVGFMIGHRNFFSYVHDASAYHNFVLSRKLGFNFGALEEIVEILENLIDKANMVKTVGKQETNLECFRKFFQVKETEKLEVILEKFLGSEDNSAILNFLTGIQETLQVYAAEWEKWFKLEYKPENTKAAQEKPRVNPPAEKVASSMSKMFNARAVQERATLSELCDPSIRVETNNTTSISEEPVFQTTSAHN